MPTFGTTERPVRNPGEWPIEVNRPGGFMLDPPDGQRWWVGLSEWWHQSAPPAVTRATAILTNPLVRLPWVIETKDRQIMPTDPDYPAWLTDPMLLNGSTGGPNHGRLHMLDRIDRFDFWAAWVRDACWLGIGVLKFEPDSNEQPKAGSLQRIDPSRLTRNEDHWALATRDGIQPINDQGRISATDEGRPETQIVLLRHSLPGGVFGRHRAQLRLAERITGYANETFETGVPSGVLSTEQPINQMQADQTREEWESTQRRRRVAVIGNGAKYSPVLISPVDAELVAMARLSNEQVAHMFELPAWCLDASTNSMTYANATDNRQDLVDGPMASWSARIEETLGALLPWGQRLKIDFTAYTTPTTSGEPL